MKYKMVVTDFDNTLLRTDHTIAPETWQAIKQFEAEGGKFVIATGRMLSTMLRTIENFGLKGELIAFQGGVVYDLDSGNVLLKKYVDQADGEALLKDLQERGYYIQTYSDGKYFVNRYTKRTERYEKVNDLAPVVTGEDLVGYVREHGLKLDKIVFGLDDDGDISDYMQVEPVIREYEQKLGGRMEFNSSNTMLIEAISCGCNKGQAVEFVAARNGIKRQEVICMGDALNDASMVKWAGLGVAVSNATFDLKEVADEITVSCDEDAVGTIIRKYCLGEERC